MYHTLYSAHDMNCAIFIKK